ncbi:YdcF family protein [Clostridioides difficile]|uniref:YdcF family protein n=1 Tax=Clostridioides difficile TaxID=1496 RepID=UPI000BB1B326|nr:YdcF family protein [Clostridioides difficile]AUA25571.1 YdcF family protein [Clostridioides difficile]EGT4611219.1 YdcF family protein [Clostridioides difficile]EJA6376192.1 YdcF family protein [Clostridioides difficile]EJA6818030.1 YdcF family protein [Clostridioides difficile]EKG1744217.1 YdcF family protein [Clostridioides difficile]
MLNSITLILGIIFTIYYFYLKIVFGGISFSEIFLVVGIVLIIYQIFKKKIKEKKVFYRVLKIIISIFLIVFVVTESLIIFYPQNSLESKSDYLLILGASVKKTTPSTTLKGRLDTALKYLKINDNCYVVVSGGKGSGEKITEAKAMKDYLIKNGIDKNRIIEEDKSTNTYENFKYSKLKIEEHSQGKLSDLKVKIVTTDFHVLRSKILAYRNGYKNTSFYASKSKLSFVPTYYTREFFALWKTIIFDR